MQNFITYVIAIIYFVQILSYNYYANAENAGRLEAPETEDCQMKTVLVYLPLERRHRDMLEAAGKGCRFVYALPGDDIDALLPQAEIIIGNVPTGKLPAAEKLELLQLNSSGAAEYTEPGVLAPGVKLTNATGAYSRPVAEHSLAATLMLQKNLHLYRDQQNAALWEDRGPVKSIDGAVVAVVGLGDIGLRYARMAKALGAYTIGIKRRGGACPEGEDELQPTDKLMEILPRADVVASFLPGTKDTEHMYTSGHFRAMKNSAIFINSGRGNAVDPDVLYEALKSGQIAAAAIDVTEPEPLPADSPLWGLENLLITPHVSGGYHMSVTLETIIDIACRNLSAYLSGGELINVVDFKTGYRK